MHSVVYSKIAKKKSVSNGNEIKKCMKQGKIGELSTCETAWDVFEGLEDLTLADY